MKKKKDFWMIQIGIVVLLGLLALCLAGCKSTTFEQTLANGTRLRATDRRAFVNTAAKIIAAVNPTNGLIEITVDATSSPANETLKALAEGAVAGAIKMRP